MISTRKNALNLLKQHIKQENLLKHSLAVEAILGSIAETLKEDENLWGLTGLLHDMDFEYTKNNPEKHGLVSEKLICDIVPEEITYAIKAHNYEHTGCTPKSNLDKALIAADAVSGFLIATALVIPSKKLSDIKTKTIHKKFKDKSFAKGCSRDRIKMCEELGLSVDDFLILSLEALQNRSSELGL